MADFAGELRQKSNTAPKLSYEEKGADKHEQIFNF